MRSFVPVLLLALSIYGITAGIAEAASRSGIGLQVVPIASGELVVLQVLAASPASRSGLQPGDLLIEVGGRKLAGSEFSQVAAQTLWGAAGTEVSITYRRPGVTGETSVTLTRTELTAEPEALPGVRLLQPSQSRKVGGKP